MVLVMSWGGDGGWRVCVVKWKGVLCRRNGWISVLVIEGSVEVGVF